MRGVLLPAKSRRVGQDTKNRKEAALTEQLTNARQMTSKNRLVVRKPALACLIALNYLEIGEILEGVWLLKPIKHVDQEIKNSGEIAWMEPPTNVRKLR